MTITLVAPMTESARPTEDVSLCYDWFVLTGHLERTIFKSVDGRWNMWISDGDFTLHRTGGTPDEARKNAEAAWLARS